MTGSRRPELCAGRNTFRYRQFSDVLATPNGEAGWGQCGAKLVAGRMPRHGLGGTGGRQRSGPTGGAAYGIPRNSAIRPAAALPASLPRTAPPVVGTTSRPPAGRGAAALAPAAGAPAIRAPAVIIPRPIRVSARRRTLPGI